MNQIQPMDWSATAAWIALAISIIGTIAGPIITTVLTNKHQLKLRKMDNEQKKNDEYVNARNKAINSFISNTGKCLSFSDIDTKKDFGYSYHNVYAYVPRGQWQLLDTLYDSISSQNWDDARDEFSTVVHKLSLLLKETPQ